MVIKMNLSPLTKGLVEIKNGQMAGKREVVLKPASKLLVKVLEVMKNYGYITGYECHDDNRGGIVVVSLNGRINNCGVISPRFSVKVRDIEKFESRYLPARNFGKLILTSTRGIISNEEAKGSGIGGKLLAFVY